MDENAKKIQREIAKDKIQIILASIALAVLIIMEFYIMINYKSNFLAMAVGILLMIVVLFFLISALLDISLKQKDIEQEKYEEIYNAQKASYLVIKKSFDEMDQRLKNIEQNSSLPAEDIINAQKAVAKVTISRSKENTDALMNSNDELINQLVNIQEKIDSNNSQILEKQQTLLKESNFDIEKKIIELRSQISNIEGKIQNGIPVMATQVQMAPPVMPAEPVMNSPLGENTIPTEPQVELEESVEEPIEDLGIELEEAEEPVEDLGIELEEAEEPVEDLGIDLEEVEDSVEDLGIELEATEDSVEDLGTDLETSEEPIEDLGLDLDSINEEVIEEVAAEPAIDEAVEEIIEESISEAAIEEPEEVTEEPVMEEVIEEPVIETATEEPEKVTEEPVIEEVIEEQVIEEVTKEAVPEAVVEEAAEEIKADDPGADLDALLEEIGEEVEPEPEPEPEPTPEPEPAPSNDEVVIPDVGIDLTDPNRVMSPEEIEKLFASI